MIAGSNFEQNGSEIVPYIKSRDANTEARERDLNLTLNAACMHSTANSNGAYVDLKSQCVKEIPTYFCDIFKNVQYLYLERNIIEELPNNFLPSLPFLKWLDIRNNLLHSIPTSIAHHPMLETLLLQENRIAKLPTELGLVPRLRGIQLKGNPITYPPQEVIAKGLQAMLMFLRSEMEIETPTDIQPVSELFYQNTKPFDPEEKRMSRKFQSKSCTNNSLRSKKSFQYPSHILALKSSQMSCVGNKKPLFSNNKVRPKFLNQMPLCDEFPSSFNEMQLPDGDCFTTEEKLLFPLRQKPSAYEIKMINREEKIQENFMKEMWICKLRDMLEQQGKVIQRRKDQEILNGWRMDYRKSQSIPRFQKHDFSAPYDINSDLHLDGTEKTQPLKREEKQREIGEEMAEIFQSLQCLNGSKLEDSLSPKSKQLMLDKEMQQLAKLQKQLALVQKRNTIEYQMLKEPEKHKRPHARKSAPNLKFSD